MSLELILLVVAVVGIISGGIRITGNNISFFSKHDHSNTNKED